MTTKCTYCKRKLKDKWSYCPSCGTQTNKRVSMFNLLKRQMDILRNLMLDDNYESRRVQSPQNAITIRINSRGFGQPNVRVLPKPVPVGQEPYQERRQSERKITGKIIEPKVNVKRLAKEMIITIPLPGVKSELELLLAIRVILRF